MFTQARSGAGAVGHAQAQVAAGGLTSPTAAAAASSKRATAAGPAASVPQSPVRPAGASPKAGATSPRPSPRTPRAPAPAAATATSRSPRAETSPRRDIVPVAYSGPLQAHSHKSTERTVHPGPGAYEPVSSLGKSTTVAPSPPSHVFGTSQKLPPFKSPSADHYLTHDEPGKGVTSSKRNVPSFSFGASRGKTGFTETVSTLTSGAPFLEPSRASTLGTAPTHVFSKSPRLEEVGRAVCKTEIINPDYCTVNKSVVSTKPNAPQYRFGSTPREVPIGPSIHEQSRLKADPTVLPMTQTTSLGRMVDSRKPTPAAHRFGTTERMMMDKHLKTTMGVDFVRPPGIGEASPVKTQVPAFGFGTASRDTTLKTGILVAHSS